MKLFVWNKVYSVSYGGAIAYAAAETEEEAREAIRAGKVSKYGYPPRDAAPPKLNIDGPADRCMDLPCGEIYEWQE